MTNEGTSPADFLREFSGDVSEMTTELLGMGGLSPYAEAQISLALASLMSAKAHIDMATYSAMRGE